MIIEGSSLSAALAEWTEVIGSDHVHCDPESLRAAGTATFATKARVKAIIRPANRDEVQRCVRVADRLGVPVYPISSGKNWGYGSRAPVQNGVLLDLGRLNRILDFDEDLAYVTIEPGVTQRQLHEYLKARQSKLWMDATGASPDCSIIGNTLERGFGHTPMGEHCNHVCGMEVVLPTGECIDTGFSRFMNSKVGPVNRYGAGPSLDGLFAQSNFGVVTRMTVWLMPAPEHFQAFFFMCKDEGAIGPVIDALRPLRLNGTLRSAIHIGNDYKVLTATIQYPWADTQGETPLGRSTIEAIRNKLVIGCWNGAGGLYGTRGQVRDARKQIKRALKGKVDRLQFVDDRLLRVMARFATPFRLLTGWDIRRTLKVIAPVYNLMKGVPTDSTMASTYWRKRVPAPEPEQIDPDRAGCGLLWCSPVVPLSGSHAIEVTQLATSILLTHGFEPQISLSLATERSLICVTTISYDRNVLGDDERALRCYNELTEELLARGYPPYRLNVGSMKYVAADDAYARVLRALKATLDPRGVLAPGRYEPDAARAVSDATVLARAGR